MLISPDFVYLHFAKTGGTFVGFHLRQNYPGSSKKKSRLLALLTGQTPNLINTADYPSWRIPHHASAKLIPYMFKRKLIVSNIRNPFDRYVSNYYYGGWKEKPEYVQRLWPNGVPSKWPDLSFREFIESLTDKSTGEGALSREVKIFFGEFLPRVKFLKFENLSHDLYSLLLGFGINDPKILKNERKLPPSRTGTIKIRSSEEHWKSHYDKELIDRIIHADQYFFKEFPEYLP